MVDILQPPAQKSSRNAHSRADTLHRNHDEQSVFDGENINNSSLAQEREKNNELQVTHDFTAETQHYTDIRKRKMIATSRSLSSLTSVAPTASSNSSSSKRRRISSSSKSPSPPPSAAHTALPHAPQRHPKRAPLGNRHPSTSQQTTLDKFLNGNTTKEHQLLSAVAASQRPTKKARRNSPDDPSVSMATDATLINHQQPENRESPETFNVLSSLSNGDRIRTRQRSTPLTDSAHISPEIVTTRSSQRRAQPVIIADQVSTTKKENDSGDNKTTGTAPVPEKRSLRSHDGGSRSKSELALYFPNYEQILSLEPVKTEFLSPDTTITILDDLIELPLPAVSLPTNSPSRTRRQRKSVEHISPFGNPLVELQGVERVRLPSDDSPGEVTIDPLSDELYFKAHRRHERQEKQLRNIEKERAQHEKIQLDRLLDELQGHDWLRVMGISGITDTEKKLYEPKRDHFVKEVSALIDKFRIWKEEEKRRKLEREQLQYEAANAAAQKEEQEKDGDEGEGEGEEDVDVDGKPSSSDVQSFDSSELDAAAAQQLLQEAISATATAPATGTSISLPLASPSRPQPRRRLVDELTSTPPQSQSHRHQRSTSKLSTTKSHTFPLSPHGSHADIIEEYDENKPFTSFYRKRHLRDAAFSSSRRGGRNRSAFGQPLPEINEEREFQLPSEVLTPELVLSMERKRRRLKRESRGG